MSIYYPVQGGTVTSGYGSRSSPGGIGSRNHQGIDIGAPMGTPVIAPVDMTIISASPAGGFGNLIQGKDNAGNTYQFGHLSGMNVQAGQQVLGGSIIGAVGSTGKSTGPHLHFGVKDASGKFINPANILADAKRLGSGALDKAKKILGIGAAVAAGPAGLAAAATGGLFGGESWLTQFANWLKDSSFFQRLAMVLIGLIFFGAAFALLARGQVSSQLVKAIK